MSDDAKICAWVSRHAPKDKQRAQLRTAGYRIVHIDPDGRLVNGRDTWNLAVLRCGRTPDVAIVVMPMKMLIGFHGQAKRHGCKVIVSKYRPGGEWTGEWSVVEKLEYRTRIWNPC